MYLFSKCDSFLQLWPILSKFDPFFKVWPIFPGVTHLSTLNATHFKWDPFVKFDAFFPNCDPLLQESHIFLIVIFFPGVTLFSTRDLFFQEWPVFHIWPNFTWVTHFSKCSPFFQVWPIFLNVTHSFLTLIFSSVNNLSKRTRRGRSTCWLLVSQNLVDHS